MADGDLDTTGCAHCGQTMGDFCVSNSKSSNYDFEFSVNFDRKCPIVGVMPYMI